VANLNREREQCDFVNAHSTDRSWSNSPVTALRPNRTALVAAVFALPFVPGCAASSSDGGGIPVVQGTTAPNPNGCYVKVFEQPQLRGRTDFINGPKRYVTLNGLPNGADWNNRIRSVDVGPGATVTVWTDTNFEGASMGLPANTRSAALPPAFAGHIESIDVRCVQTVVPSNRGVLRRST
jgi:hypothetical protein